MGPPLIFVTRIKIELRKLKEKIYLFNVDKMSSKEET